MRGIVHKDDGVVSAATSDLSRTVFQEVHQAAVDAVVARDTLAAGARAASVRDVVRLRVEQVEDVRAELPALVEPVAQSPVCRTVR